MENSGTFALVALCTTPLLPLAVLGLMKACIEYKKFSLLDHELQHYPSYSSLFTEFYREIYLPATRSHLAKFLLWFAITFALATLSGAGILFLLGLLLANT